MCGIQVDVRGHRVHVQGPSGEDIETESVFRRRSHESSSPRQEAVAKCALHSGFVEAADALQSVNVHANGGFASAGQPLF